MLCYRSKFGQLVENRGNLLNSPCAKSFSDGSGIEESLVKGNFWGELGSLKLIIYKLKIYLNSTFSFCYNLDHIFYPDLNFHEAYSLGLSTSVLSSRIVICVFIDII